MGWLWAIIVGFVLGLIAKAVIPGKQHSPLWLTTICGMLGAIVGNAVARARWAVRDCGRSSVCFSSLRVPHGT
jgi:uncharacterized membrane protein YeaQ/YmgE (transglycosylase-associated protein family)